MEESVLLPEIVGISELPDQVGRADEAAKVEAALTRGGAQHDPRTLALFLATRGEQIELAIELAQNEFGSRADIFTHDALAWALVAASTAMESATGGIFIRGAEINSSVASRIRQGSIVWKNCV